MGVLYFSNPSLFSRFSCFIVLFKLLSEFYSDLIDITLASARLVGKRKKFYYFTTEKIIRYIYIDCDCQHHICINYIRKWREFNIDRRNFDGSIFKTFWIFSFLVLSVWTTLLKYWYKQLSKTHGHVSRLDNFRAVF